MSDTTYQVLQDGDGYKVRISRLGRFMQEAGGFTSIADANAWVAQDQRLAVRAEQREPLARPHLRVI